MLLSIKSWLFETPSKDCMASYAKSGDNRYLEQLIALYSNDLNHYSGSVGLCGLKFVQTRGDLIAARGL
ncbi:hypothetical protein [Pseudoalteromonas distincta]|uniref:hypothetical protein n=1 Tax=Pseudoalteromonas distincta TaxID=77608 RepID=UPI00351D98FC